MPHITTRIQDTEASLGEKMFLLEIIGQAAVSLSEQTPDSSNTQAQTKKIHEKILSDDEFFKAEDEQPIILAGKITKRLKPTKIAQGRKNLFIPVA